MGEGIVSMATAFLWVRENADKNGKVRRGQGGTEYPAKKLDFIF